MAGIVIHTRVLTACHKPTTKEALESLLKKLELLLGDTIMNELHGGE